MAVCESRNITLEFLGVSKRYGALCAVRKLDLRLLAKSTTVLLGPSGCGKSTLLRLLIGLTPPDSGSILFAGQEVSGGDWEGLRSRMGYVIQDGGLFPHRTAAGNLSLLPRHRGWTSERIQARIGELSELTKFPATALQRYPVELSGGQRQRVSLMRALMLDPDVLLLDEPLGALDPMIRAELQEDLLQIFQSLGKTVVLVTHDLAEAAHFGHEIVLLRAGEIVQQGSFESLMRRPADDFVRRFIRAQRPPAVDLEEDGG
jgi:osmoprotectant transport system ATP-binding protein